MKDSGKIIIGLIVFLVLITLPIWYNVIGGTSADRPEVEIATKNIPGKDECVMPTEYMMHNHMNLLNEWRDQVVRKGERIHIAPNGKQYNMSLTQTCLDCHSNRDKFCDRCHSYVAVEPYCWTCHVIPEGDNQ